MGLSQTWQTRSDLSRTPCLYPIMPSPQWPMQWRPVSCHLWFMAPGEGLSGFGRLYDRNWIVWVDFIFMFDNTWHTLPLGNFRTQQISAVSAKLAYIFCGINLPRAISVQILVFLTNYNDILSWPWPNLSSNKKWCHLVVNVVNAVQWHYLVDKVGAGDGRGSPRLVFYAAGMS